jgi:tetratricopeptide (TPR) repeat protein
MDEATRRQFQHQASEYRKNGQFEKAIESYTQLITDDDSPVLRYSRGSIYLLTGNSVAALTDFEHATVLAGSKYRIDSHYIMRGICYWNLDRPSRAIHLWHQSLTANYTDAAGGVVAPALLLYAAERLADESLRREACHLLKQHWYNHQRRLQRQISRNSKLTHEEFVHPGLLSWPGAMVPFLLEEISMEELYAAAAKSYGGKTDRGLAQADFYFAVRALREGNQPSFKEGMTRCAQRQDGFLEDEYFLAKWEVEHNFRVPAFG